MRGIKFERVTKIYPGTEKPAVNNVSLEVKPGEFIVLLGSSGCGKTTLLKMVNRLYEITEGIIYLGGDDIRKLPVNDLRRRIGYVIQQSGLFPHMTVEQNIAVVPEMLGWDKKRTDQRIDVLLELVHLDPKIYRKRYPKQLSGGQQQRIGLARALAADPPFMLMDEPFGAIDAITRTKLQEELIQIQKKLNKTIMFVTHDVDEALRLADKIIIMKDGQVVQYATPLEIIANSENEFVSNLVGGDDVMRQMGLINVKVAMEPIRHEAVVHGNTISEHADLKQALSVILQSSFDLLYVVNNDNHLLGQLSMSNIQGLLAPSNRDKILSAV